MATFNADNKSFIRWLAGDPDTGISISASGTLRCGPIDLSRTDLAAASIVLSRSAGTGTLKATAFISPDGANVVHSLGDIITSVTTESKAWKLSDAAMSYGRFLIIDIVETGASASATAKCVFMAQGS